jgi:hypothetical protein
MTIPARFACSLAGDCEVDDEHGYFTQTACEQNCRPTSLPLEVAYQVLGYIAEDALRLAPSDRVETIYQYTGITVPVVESRAILLALINEDLPALTHYPILYPWLAENVYPEDWVYALQEAATLSALQELVRLGYPLTQDTLDLFFTEGSPADIAAYHELNDALPM